MKRKLHKALSLLLCWALLCAAVPLPALADEEVTLTILDTEEAQIPEAAETAEPAETQPPVGNASAGGDPAARAARAARPSGCLRRI